MDIGRNEPCPCGSGKKFKRCCGAPKSDPLELAAGAIRAIQDTAEEKIVRLVRDDFGDSAFGDAWIEFDLTEGSLDPERHDEAELFGSWLFYDWEPWEQDRYERRPREIRFTPAAGAIAGRGIALSPRESDVLMRVAMTPASFHEVIATDSKRATTLRDILLGTELTVFENFESSTIRVGDIVYGRAVDFDDVGLMIGPGQFLIPPIAKSVILDAKLALRRRPGKLTALKLCREEPLLRSVYFKLRHRIVDPHKPELKNTDGELIEFHTLTYTIASPEAAVLALASLSEDDDARLLAEARRNRPGGSGRVSFSWTRPGSVMHRGMPNTVLADFKITGTTMRVEVNSSKRAKKVKAEIAKRLGDQATFVRDDRKSMDEALSETATKPESRRDRAARLRDEELQALPEVQAMLAKYNADHYATWPDVPLPALKGKTPRAAMKTADGRERVEALIADFERSQDAGRVSTPRYDFNQLRAVLGLPLRET